MTAVVAVVLLGRYMQMQTGHGLPGVMMIVGQPESANGANRNSRWSRPCIVQVPTCFVVTIWWSKSKLVIYSFFHRFFFSKSTLNYQGTLQCPFQPPVAEIGNQKEYPQTGIFASESASLYLWLFQHIALPDDVNVTRVSPYLNVEPLIKQYQTLTIETRM